MATLFFILTIVFFILWITKEPKAPQENLFARGYWEGYRAFAERVQTYLHANKVDKSGIQAEIDAAISGDFADSSDSQQDASSVAAAANVADPQIEHERKALKNMNMLLFMASLLFVAAGAAFIATTMPSAVKLVAMWLLVALFYGVGFVLYGTDRLKPAGIAFIGTGLGLVPFAGIALYALADFPGAAVWWLTSFVGIIMYFFAAVRLRSQTVSYLTIAFVVSFASSFVESVSVPIVWNLVLLILLSSTLGVINYLKPKWVVSYFAEPIKLSGYFLTPLVILASIVLTPLLSLQDYQLLFLVVTVQYCVGWLQNRQFWQETLVRALLSVTILLYAWDFTNGSSVAFGLVLLAVALGQQIYSIMRYSTSDRIVVYTEWAWLYIMQFVQLCTVPFWVTSAQAPELTALSLTLIGLSSLAATLHLRDARAALSGVIVSVVLPFVVFRWVVDPALSWEFVTSWFVLASAAVLAGYHYFARQRSLDVRVLLGAAFAAFVLAAFTTVFLGSLEWAVLFFAVLTVLAWLSSYVLTQPLITAFASFLFFVFVYKFYELLQIPAEWQLVATAWTAAAAYYSGYGVLTRLKDAMRTSALLVATWVALVLAVVTSFSTPGQELLAAVAIILIGTTVGVEGYLKKNKALLETAVYIASFGAQRYAGVLNEDLNLVFYAHWWAAVVGAMAWWRGEVTVRLKVAAGFVTASTGIFALYEGGVYQLLFLAEHVALLIAGAMLQKRWAIWWGLIAAILAVLYFLREVTFLAFAFLGVVIVAIVVWRLTKISKQ